MQILSQSLQVVGQLLEHALYDLPDLSVNLNQPRRLLWPPMNTRCL